MAKLLLVGLASDGPSDVVIKPKNERDLRFLLGGGFTERVFVSQTATSLTLNYTPWILPINKVEGHKNYLFSPVVSGTNLVFGPLGAVTSGASLEVDLLYTPYLGKGDVLFAARKYFEQLGDTPYILRIGGSKARLEIGGWEFESKYAGDKYNGLSLTFTASSVSVSGLEPNYPSATYSSSVPSEIKELIYRDFQTGVSPVICTKIGSALFSGSYTMTGAVDGSFSLADIENMLLHATIPLEVTHVLLLTPISSGIIDLITDHLTDSAIQPRMFFMPSPTYTTPGSTWVREMFQQMPFRSNMIASFVGDVTTRLDGFDTERYAAEAAAIAFAKVEGYNLTNVPVNAVDFSPVLDEEHLALVKGLGFIPLMRYIKNDISIYEGTTTSADTSFLYSSKLAEVVAIARDYCYRFIGSNIPEGENAQMAQELSSRLSAISYLQIQLVRILVRGDSMYVHIESILPSEILRISFTIKNR